MSDQFVYFIQADDGGPIKIGYTSDDPKRRLAQLQTGNASALKLLGAIRATQAQERQFHATLAEWRMQGEWFEPHPTVLATIEIAMAATPETHGCGGEHCSFCGNCQSKTPALIAGPNEVFICSACVTTCAEIVSEQLVKFVVAVDLSPFPEMGYGG